jgi:hypothetical protein
VYLSQRSRVPTDRKTQSSFHSKLGICLCPRTRIGQRHRYSATILTDTQQKLFSPHSVAIMSHPPSLSHARTGNGSMHSHTLLTPPLSPATSEDIPFKPRDDDENSLSMKRRHRSRLHNHERRRLNRACASSSELRVSPVSGVLDIHQRGRSKSLPSLELSTSSWMLKSADAIKITGTDHRDLSKRRWTLPSKAQPTQGLADRVLVEKKPAVTTFGSRDNPSPAMITLRRASISRPPERKMSLTFFPPPKFSRQKSGLLTTFLQTITRTEVSEVSQIGTDPKLLEARRASVVSFKKGHPETPRKASAPTVFTKVAGMPPSLLQPIPPEREAAVRRCSTTFISSGSTYEVIWDENVSSSGTGTASSGTAAESRRRSSAVDKLEVQLSRAIVQSRRNSVEPLQMNASNNELGRNGSFSSLLSARLSRSLSFRHGSTPLPRSRSQKNRCPVISLPEEDSEIIHKRDSGAIEFFPPLRSRSTTASSQHKPAIAFETMSSDVDD